LIALGHLAAEPRYVAAGERTVQLFAPALEAAPAGYASLLTALEDAATPPSSVLLAGDPAVCGEWQRQLERTARAGARAFNVAGCAVPAELAKGPPIADGAVAWVCRGTQCLPPIRALADLFDSIGRER